MKRHGTFLILHVAKIVLIGLLGSLAFACQGASVPSDSEARKFFIESNGTYFYDGRTQLSNFRKTDGVPGEDVYEYDYEATLNCLKDINFGFDEKGMCRAGKTITVTGRLLLQRTENGWRLVG
jgi:hypothetical protein